ncbi:MAG: FkbM family methyltransferase [Verrucomicrobiota bacterium]
MKITDKASVDFRRERAKLKRQLKLKKARRKIFIDCGANTFKVTREYMKKLPLFEFYAFEAQPELKDEVHKVLKEMPGRKLTFLNQAVWTKNETVHFFLATKWGPNFKGGSTLMNHHEKNSSQVDYENPIPVEAIDFSAWLMQNFSKEDFITIKMDIEGAEYAVLEKMLEDKSMDLVDEFLIEFHQKMNSDITLERHERLIEQIRRRARLQIWQ